MVEKVDKNLVVDEESLPREFNAAVYFVDRHMEEGRIDKTAFIDKDGEHSYSELYQNVNKAANLTRTLGLKQESRVAMIVQDNFDYPVIYWGCIKAGVIPVTLNTLLTKEHYVQILNDCRARILFISDNLYEVIEPVIGQLHYLEKIIISGEQAGQHNTLSGLLENESNEFEMVKTFRDEVAFWLYSSGSTGTPKGVMHRHSSLYWIAELFGKNVLNISEDDIVFSVAKLFFAYGLGNGMAFPLGAGATIVLCHERVTPDIAIDYIKKYNPSIFYGVPTLYAAMIAKLNESPIEEQLILRLCVSAGEALPEETGNRWKKLFNVDILDGVGSTEMLHIFLSNQQDDINYGTSGKNVPGYQVKLINENEDEIDSDGEIGELLVSGPSAPEGYWNNRIKTIDTFRGKWTCSGDKYYRDEKGYYHYCGRTDEMFKSGGNWVSPFEVESTLIANDKVLEAAIVPHEDDSGNMKPKAFVIVKDGVSIDDGLDKELQEFVKSKIELWKYPRWIEFVDSLPKTATGKIQRYKLKKQ